MSHLISRTVSILLHLHKLYFVMDKTKRLEADYFNLLTHYHLPIPTKDLSFEERYKIIQDRRNNNNKAFQKNATTWQSLISAVFLDTEIGLEEKVKLLSQHIQNSSPLEGNARFIGSLLVDKRISLSQPIYFNIFPTGEFNAGAYRTENGTLCLLNKGILKLIYSITYNCFYLLSERAFQTKKNIKSQVAGYVIKVICDYLTKNNLSPIFINQLELDKDSAMDVLCMNIAVRNFIVAHEVGHIVLGHIETENRLLMLDKDASIPITNRSYEMEFEADAFAQELLLYSDMQQRLPISIVSGGIAFFLIHLMILNVQAKLKGDIRLYQKTTESHPSTFERLQRLDNFLQPLLPTKESRVGLANCTVLQSILLEIEQFEISIEENEKLILKRS